MSKNLTVAINIFANPKPAVDGMGQVEEAATHMSSKIEVAAHAAESAGEKFENLATATSTFAGSFGDIGDALIQTTQTSHEAERAALGLESAQKQYNAAVAQYGANSLEARTALLGVKDAQNQVAANSSFIGKIGTEISGAQKYVRLCGRIRRPCACCPVRWQGNDNLQRRLGSPEDCPD